MGIFSFINRRKGQSHAELMENVIRSESMAYGSGYYAKPYPSYTEVWDGEKNWGELGYPINYLSDFRNLALRSWQSYYESDITQIAINNYLLWVVGRGLNLNSEPLDKIVLRGDVSFNRDDFTEDVESWWKIYSQDKRACYNQMGDINTNAYTAKMNAIIGGDVLVIMRYDGNIPSIQLIDGLHITNPLSGNFEKEAKDRGNSIRTGVEVDPTGKHIAYYIHEGEGKYNRVEATAPSGRLQAWLIYGSKYRIDDHRGMPLIAVVLEELKKLSRYKDAAIGSAEENAKVALTIEHDNTSTGENPYTKATLRAATSGQPTVPETVNAYDDGQKIAMTTQKQVFNMEPGASLKAHTSEKELAFKDFFTINFEIICASLGIPPEVALNKYNSNYSASRMASKMWEHRVIFERDHFSKFYYKPIYNFWLDTRVLRGNIIAAGYTNALIKNDVDTLIAYRNCFFNGPNMPHVDPIKEVKAELAKVSGLITTRDRATKNLNEGDWLQNANNLKKENDKIEELGLIPEASTETEKMPENPEK